jgi:hypothetical protein
VIGRVVLVPFYGLAVRVWWRAGILLYSYFGHGAETTTSKKIGSDMSSIFQ